MDRANDTRIPPSTSWLNNSGAQSVCAAVRAGGRDIYFVGGCVRNALLGLDDSDVDLATDAVPAAVTKLVEAAGLKAVPTGIDHGTVTVVADGEGFEVTTFRRDVQTDGRRAVVAFSTDIEEDARRRDFTMNALYATPEGALIDPLGGLEDLRARRIRFIEDASARIREDYLRILRFFRFSAWYADPSKGFDPETLSAITSNLGGLETLSAERIGAEFKKLLNAPDPAPALAVMRQTGVLPSVLPGADDRWVAVLVHLEAEVGTGPDWLCRLAALGGQDVSDRLRLSRVDARQLNILREAAYSGSGLAEIAYRYGEDVSKCAAMLRAAMAEQPLASDAFQQIDMGVKAVFPIKAADLMPTYSGAALGERLSQLESHWIESGFSARRDALLSLPDS